MRYNGLNDCKLEVWGEEDVHLANRIEDSFNKVSAARNWRDASIQSFGSWNRHEFAVTTSTT